MKAETILPVANLPEAVTFAQFVSEMSPEQRREMLIFMQGVKFAWSAEATFFPVQVCA